MKYPINFSWSFNSDYKKEYLKAFVLGEIVDLPHTTKEIPLNYFNKEDYEKRTTYQKLLNFKVGKNECIYLTFYGVMLTCKVYLNGHLVKEHLCGYTEFTCDLTKHFNSEEDNLLTVVVDSTENKNVPPFGGVVDYLCYGGIYREVEINIKPKINISHLYVEGDMNGLLQVRYDLNNPKHEEYKLNYELFDKDNRFVGAFKEDHYQVSNVNLWSIDTPYLYKVKVILTSKYGIEEQFVKVGFRTATFKENGFYLNGKRIKLRGLNRHQSYPYVGYAMPKSMQEQDADILKNKLGVNFVRCSHYPMSHHFFARCDELGLVCLEEIPGWQYVSDNNDWRKVHLSNVEEMVKTLFNHPSIIIWGVRINEGKDDHDLYVEANKIAKTIDPSRCTGGVRNFKGSELLEDVYTYNDFYHNGKNHGLDKPKSVCKKAPYLVTEYNGHMYPTKAYDQEDRVVEHALRHARVLDAMYEDERISGCSGWCMNDYNTHKEFGSGDMICYHGVNDIFRNEKYAASIYASQQDKFPVLKVLSLLQGGEKNESMQGNTFVATNADYIELYKNGEKINDFYPAKKMFPHLPHAPIIIDDYIGQEIVKDGTFKKKDALKITEAVNYAMLNGLTNLKLKHYLLMLRIVIKYHMRINTLIDYLSKFVISWGDEAVTYEVKALKDGKVIATQKLGPANEFILKACEDFTMHIGDTYDVKEIFVKAVDQNNNTLRFCFEPLQIKTSGAIELIGPSNISLQAGQTGIYIKTLKKGKGKVVITSRFNTITINVSVI